MAIRRRQNWLGQQRVDLPHLKSIESAVSNDFDELIAGLIIGENKSFVVRGFNINMPGSIGGSANGLQLIVEDASFLHGASNESGTFFTIPTGTPAEVLSSTTNEKVEGSFTPNTENYIGIEFAREINDDTVDQVYFWNPTTNVENTRNVPLAIILDYRIVISTGSFASNVMPVAVVQTDSSNNVVSITDRRPLLFRLGTAGANEPNPFYSFPWNDGRNENFYTSTSSTSDPFVGGDKQISNMKEFFDALMTEFKELKGTPYWYSPSAGSILRVRQDIANTVFTGKGNISHGLIDFRGQVAGMTTDVIIKQSGFQGVGPITLTADSVTDIDGLISAWNAANPDNEVVLFSGDGTQVPTGDIILTSKSGQINWNSDVFLNFIGGRLRYKINKNEATDDITLADNEVAYINLIRGVDITPNLVFTNGGTVVTSVGSVNWTTDLQAGDFIKDASRGDEFYYEILSVDSLSQVTLTEPFQETSSGPAGFDAQYAFGVYETNPAPSTPRHVQVADRGSVPFDEDYFWLFFRKDDTGSISKIYSRVTGGQEIEQGESQNISDNTSLAVLNYIGSASESDNDPDYAFLANDVKTGTENYNTDNGENLTIRASKLTSMMADKAQDKLIKITSDHTTINNVENSGDANLQDITFSGGSGTATVAMPSSANNGTIGLGSTLELAENQVAYFNVDRNAAFNLADLDALTVSNIDSVTLSENVFIFAYRLTGKAVYLWNNQALIEGTSITVAELTSKVRQNKTVKLVKGGTWSWDLATNTLANSASAFIQLAGFAEDVNEIAAQNIVLAADGECAYVSIKRTAGASTLSVTVADIAVVPETDDVFIIARRNGDEVIVGSNSFKLADEEFLTLDGALQEINRYNGQLNALPNNPVDTRIRVTGSDIAKLSGSQISLEQRNLLLKFEGVEIDFATGEVFEADGVTSFLGGANDFTPFTIPSGEFFYYSVSVLPNQANADNTISGQILVIPATASNAVLADAPKAPFPGTGLKLANIYVQEDGAGGIFGIDYENIIQLGVGGSGGGSGDANSDLTRYQDRLAGGNFNYANTNIASIDEDEQLDVSSTATFDIPTGTFKFADSTAQVLLSTQNLDAEWLAEERDLNTVEFYGIWEEDNFDTGATYEISRDGGNNWQTLATNRIGLSDAVRAIHTFSDEPANAFNQEYAVANADDVKTFTDTTQQQVSQQFTVANATVYKDVFAYINKATGALGRFYLEIVRDNAGSPSTDINDIAWTSAAQNISTLADGNNVVQVGASFALDAGDYHLIIKTDQEYKDTYNGNNALKIAARIDSSSGPVPNLRTWDGSAWSAQVADETLTYRLEGRVLDLRVRITSSATADDKLLRSYAVYYDLENGVEVTSPVFRELFSFDGTVDNLNEFTLTNFLPDSRLLMCFARGVGQVFRYGDFVLDGHTVIFPENTFNVTGTVELEFFQLGSVQGVSSTVADALVTANHLGSSDPAIDKSVAGRGIVFRNEAGQLVEVGLDEFNNFTFTIL